MRLLSFFFASFFLFLLLNINFALASEGTIEIEPAYIEVEIKDPAQEEDITITFKNNSQKTISLEIFPVDFKQQNERGGVSFLGKEAGSYSYSLSSFLSFETDKLIIAPGKTEKLRVTVKNRLDLSPGGHYAAVVGRLTNDSKTENLISPALSSLIFMRKVGGERFNLSIKDVDWPSSLFVFRYPTSFDITFQNEGNIHLTPYGRGEITDMFGRLIYKGILNTSSAIVMPESRRLVPVEFRQIGKSLPISINKLSIKGQDSLKKTNFIYEESFIYINPFLLTVPLFLFAFWFLRKRRNS